MARDVRTYSVIVGKLDETVSSRIHVNLHLLSLDPEGRKQIWRTLFETFMRDYPDVLVDERTTDYTYVITSSTSAKLELNGREMRNGI